MPFNIIPDIKIEATSWAKLVDAKGLAYEPPVTQHLTEMELLATVQPFTRLDPSLYDFPIHSQSVERAVKLVSEASKHAYSMDKRHGIICGKQKSRKKRKRFPSKKDYLL